MWEFDKYLRSIEMLQQLLVGRRREQNMFIKEGDKQELWIWGMEESSDRRGLFLADFHNQNVKYFKRDKEMSRVVYQSDLCVSNLRLLADYASAFITFESTCAGFFFNFIFSCLFLY